MGSEITRIAVVEQRLRDAVVIGIEVGSNMRQRIPLRGVLQRHSHQIIVNDVDGARIPEDVTHFHIVALWPTQLRRMTMWGMKSGGRNVQRKGQWKCNSLLYLAHGG